MNGNRLELGMRNGWNSTWSQPTGQGEDRVKLIEQLDELDVLYRFLVAIMFNCVPNSGHPGGSISSGKIIASLLYNTMDYDLTDPDRPDADQLVLAAGHKALGLYAAFALRDELVRIYRPELLPSGEIYRLRLEDLLGFRKNPTCGLALMKKFSSKPLDGHPTPATPFVRLATGASGVGVPGAFGLAWSLMDLYPDDPPVVHVVEGEGGLTPGRVSEAMAAASTANLHNIVLHIDWNQASIDSDRVCADGSMPGDYVQWNPVELGRFHDFNVLLVNDGHDTSSVLGAQRYVLNKGRNNKPTCIVYRTIKGWRYGIEGRWSHGAGHGCCSEGFYSVLGEFEELAQQQAPRMQEEKTPEALERYYWKLLSCVRKYMESHLENFDILTGALKQAEERLQKRQRRKRHDSPDVGVLFDPVQVDAEHPPSSLQLEKEDRLALRQALGLALGELNRRTAGAIVVASADLAGSTSVSLATEGFGEGFFNADTNPASRMLSMGGICEDAMGAWMSSLGVMGSHIGVGSSYGAFIAALQHVPMRLHCIAQQARTDVFGGRKNPYIMVAAHAGLKTGEDGPTHADPQCLQLLQENFPRGSVITLTPWEPSEVWPLLVAALQKCPAVVAPLVTRPEETVPDRGLLGLPPAVAAVNGIYRVRTADPGSRAYHGTLVIQGAGVMRTFVSGVLAEIDRLGLAMNIYYVTSAELFSLLPEEEQNKIYPRRHADNAMGITGFTLPTMYGWLDGTVGRSLSLHPFKRGRYAGSGRADDVFKQAGLDAENMFQAVRAYAGRMEKEG